jgi:hypothetical protein
LLLAFASIVILDSDGSGNFQNVSQQSQSQIYNMTDGQSASLGVRHPSGTRDLFLLPSLIIFQTVTDLLILGALFDEKSL